MEPATFQRRYKTWRNKARRFSRSSILRLSLRRLHSRPGKGYEVVRLWPWLTCLGVKWVCQDAMMEDKNRPPIAASEFQAISQSLFELSNDCSDFLDRMPVRLAMRRLMRPQIGFQVDVTKGYIRESMLLCEMDSPILRDLFAEITGCPLDVFFDLSFAFTSAMTVAVQEKRVLSVDSSAFDPLRRAYGDDVVQAYIQAVSSTQSELVASLSALPDATNKSDSELFELPALTKHPILREGSKLVCWHPQIYYRGLEHYVHNTLSSSGATYSENFGPVFESHVSRVLSTSKLETYGENRIRSWRVSSDQKHPDGLIHKGYSNIFVECKSGLYNESLFATGSALHFERKTKEIAKGIAQTRAASAYLCGSDKAPSCIARATKNYALIVTNVHLGICSGLGLAEMYDERAIEDENGDSPGAIPLANVSILSIDEFEWLIVAASLGEIEIDEFLEGCAIKESRAEDKVSFFSQRLEKDVPFHTSMMVANAFEASTIRMLAGIQ